MKKLLFIAGITCCILSLQANPLQSNKSLLPFFSIDTTRIHKKLQKKWQLVELNGQSIAAMGKRTKTPHIIFDSAHRVSGNNGCNQFFGTYELGKHNLIHFSAMGSTRMACLDNISLENDLMDVIAKTDSYVLINDTLVFNKARTAPLARWVKMKAPKNKKKKQ